MSDDALDFLMGAGVPSCSFKEIGTTHVGTIVSFEKTQQRDFTSGAPKTFDNGDPMYQLVFTLATDVVDPEIEGDDGTRKLYAKAGMLNAIREAVRKSGHAGDLVGGKLGVKYVRDGEPTRAGINPPKVYSAKFEPPVQTEALGEPDYAPDEEPF